MVSPSEFLLMQWRYNMINTYVLNMTQNLTINLKGKR